jgi:membrane protease YdiL (CAAX protease family)
MRPFLSVLAVLALALLVAAVLAYPAWWLVAQISVQPIHRVAHRVAMLAAFAGLIWWARRTGLASREVLGYGAPRAKFLRQLGIGFGVGIALMIPWVATLFALDIRSIRPELHTSIGKLVLQGLSSGFAVAFIEETFFRGILQGAVSRASGVVAGVLLPSTLYAAVHFLGGKIRVPDDQIQWSSGFDVLANLFTAYNQPLALTDSLAALFVLGILLALLRLRTGIIAGGAGLHAAGVFTISLLREATVYNPDGSWSWLVGSYDRVIGWGAAIWFVVIVIAANAILKKPTSKN